MPVIRGINGFTEKRRERGIQCQIYIYIPIKLSRYLHMKLELFKLYIPIKLSRYLYMKLELFKQSPFTKVLLDRFTYLAH